ncbi:ATP synthase [Pontibacillus chungwhensis BH030062]|uniref:ATP synthase n=3 Tax=Pontibacillus TaxID=289201 RepID=A0A0A2V2U3_9BACI|nr:MULTISPECIES: stage VI sporulation protein F [Pontibacillus]KGP93141.1 ATP synthase [Pontibacillus chungwhensis BH030062]MCD5323001.1 stage VI sporulation protein F [Pontibacillus sp. HN14]WIF96395.1 stage VI sporulation protein F [Pontibacillus chungwhensis]GGC99624.1 sporulation-specific transcription factor SpoVIF [Pontibacillus salipaludis]
MSGFQKKAFEHLQNKANISPDEIMKVADSVKNANFKDEKTVRNLVKQLSKMAGKPVSKEKEDKIVKAITNNNMDMNQLNQMFKK